MLLMNESQNLPEAEFTRTDCVLKMFRTVFLGLSLLSITACSAFPVLWNPNRAELGSPSARTEPQLVSRQVLHKVTHSGETLSLISLWYTGTSSNWRNIAALNSGIKPHHLRIGDRIIIPAKLLVRPDPLPPEFLSPAWRKKNYSSQAQVASTSYRPNASGSQVRVTGAQKASATKMSGQRNSGASVSRPQTARARLKPDSEKRKSSPPRETKREKSVVRPKAPRQPATPENELLLDARQDPRSGSDEMNVETPLETVAANNQGLKGPPKFYSCVDNNCKLHQMD